ncbi:ASCH domain-containing protein [Paraglaciecola mesophila]|nr:ASCH domain-containing protein [Paraglaciecola mesophila]
MHNLVFLICLFVFWKFFIFLFWAVIVVVAAFGLYQLGRVLINSQKSTDIINGKSNILAASAPAPLQCAPPKSLSSLRRTRPVSPKVTKTASLELSDMSTHQILKDLEKNGALIIDKPWIELILSGQKIWEMRSTKFNKAGYIALIAKGTKTIVGIAKIQGFDGPLSIEQLTLHSEKHRVPKAQFSAENYKWFVAMKLSDILRFSKPIPYKHKSGSVIWVKLMDQPDVLECVKTELVAKIAAAENALDEAKRTSEKSGPIIINAIATKVEMKLILLDKKAQPGSAGKVPLSVRGKVFNQNLCSKDGLYHIKLSSKEYRFESSSAALNALRKVESAKWATFDKRGRRAWQTTNEWIKATPIVIN